MTSPLTWRRAGARIAAVGAIGAVSLAAAALPAAADDDLRFNQWLSAVDTYNFTVTPGVDLGPQAGVFQFETQQWGEGFSEGADITLEFAASQNGVELAVFDPRCSASGGHTTCMLEDNSLDDWIQMDVELTFSPDVDPSSWLYYSVDVTYSQNGSETTYTASAGIPVESGDKPVFTNSAEFAAGVLYPDTPWTPEPQEVTLAVTAEYLPASVADPTEVKIDFLPWDNDSVIATTDDRCIADEPDYPILSCVIPAVSQGDTIALTFTLDEISAWSDTFDWWIQVVVPDETYGDWYLDYDGSWDLAYDQDGWEQYPADDVAVEGLAPGASAQLPPVRFNAPEAQSVPGLVIEFGGFNGSAITFASEYDNCASEYGGEWVICVFPDFDPAAGQTYQLSAATPLTVRAGDNAAGPYTYTGRTWVSYDPYTWYDEEYPDLFDGSYDNPLIIEAAAEAWIPESDDPWDSGYISVTTTENRYDLTTRPVEISGDTGERVTVDFEVINDSGADAEGAYVLVDLPTGVVLEPGAYTDDTDYGDGWCWLREDWWPEDRRGDIYCSVWELDAGTSRTVSLKLEIVGEAKADDGQVEVAEYYDGSEANAIETALDNNTAPVSYVGTASGGGELPKTGTSLAFVISSAAAVLVVGAVLFVIMRRRRIATDW